MWTVVLMTFFDAGCTADEAGWVAVNNATTQSTKFANIFSLGDASSMPNSKTAAAITSQAPVLVDNIRAAYDGKELPAKYDGYASCPLLTGHNELMYVCLIRMRGVSS
jgi:NADPH-dependent 2,4-dienoyl-CoA reductase/sulfur reductase-like enzyme